MSVDLRASACPVVRQGGRLRVQRRSTTPIRAPPHRFAPPWVARESQRGAPRPLRACRCARSIPIAGTDAASSNTSFTAAITLRGRCGALCPAVNNAIR